MKNFFTVIFLVLTFVVNAQIKVDNIVLDYEVEYNGETLKLNGAGTRSGFFIGKLYVGALYLQEKSHDPMAIAFGNENMAIHLEITSRLITKENLLKAIEEGYEKATDGNTKPLKSKIDKIRSLYINKINKGDKIDFVYIKDKGVFCYHNKKELGLVEGLDFKAAHFKIWLGEKPASKSLKEQMLGKS